MKILIIGSEGFIGTHLVKWYRYLGATLVGCDLYEASKQADYVYLKVSRLSPEWEDVFSGQQFDVCINASGSGNVPYSMQHPLVDFEANTLDPIRILDGIRKYNNSCKYLHISSAAVYGNPEKLPIHENDSTHPLSPYGWHKRMSELICAEYCTIYSLRTAIIRPFSVYGEGLQKQLLWDICQRLKNNDSIQLFGTGSESRDFIHCKDLVRLMDTIIQKANFKGEVYNAASGIETSIKSVAQLFEQHYKGNKKISFSGEVRKGDPLNWRADISQISVLGFAPTVSLEEGIVKYIQWFESIKDNG
jgi:UDP-glucose 4-epimerase